MSSFHSSLWRLNGGEDFDSLRIGKESGRDHVRQQALCNVEDTMRSNRIFMFSPWVFSFSTEPQQPFCPALITVPR